MKKRSRRRLHPQPGASPGTLTPRPDSPHPKIRVLAFGPDQLVEQESDEGLPPDVDRWLETFPVVWINVDGLGNLELIEHIGRRFGLHPLALADVTSTQRPKAEPYEGHLFVVCPMIHSDGDRLWAEQVSLFLTPRCVLTFQEQPGDCLEPVRERIRRGSYRIRHHGPDYLAYAILDAIVDHYFPVLEAWGQKLDELEVEVLSRPATLHAGRIHHARQQLTTLRRAIWPVREMLQQLLRIETLVARETQIFLRDCYDHAVQVLDVVETQRELCASLMDLYLSSLSHRMNEVMKVLTIMATVFIPLTFIAGVYGMNFEWMPELKWRYGYPACLAVMAVTAAGLLWWFRRKGWLDAASASPPSPPPAGTPPSAG